jgi:hypothetical protein
MAGQFFEADDVEFGERALPVNGCKHEALQLNASPSAVKENNGVATARRVPGGQWFAHQEER